MNAALDRSGVPEHYHAGLAMFGLCVFHICLLEHTIDKAIVASHKEDRDLSNRLSRKLPMKVTEKVKFLTSYLTAKEGADHRGPWLEIAQNILNVFERRKIMLHGGFMGWLAEPAPKDYRYLFVKLETGRTLSGSTWASFYRTLVRVEELEGMIENAKALAEDVKAAFPLIADIEAEIRDRDCAADMIWSM